MFFFTLLTHIPAQTVFSQKFRSAGKGPFMATKAKNIITPKVHFPGGPGGRTWPAFTWKFRSLLKCHSLNLTPILHKSAVAIFTQQLKTFDSNNFTLSSMFSFQNEWPIKTKAVHTLVLFHKYIHSFPGENKIRSQFNFSKPSSSCTQ